MASSIDNLINVAFREGQDLSGFGLKLGGKGDYRPPQFDAESLKFEYIDTNGSYGIDLNGSRFLQKLTFAESQTFTRATTGTFVGANGQIQTAAINAPRFTHDPVTRELQGLLIEEQRTNVIIDSEDLTAASWKSFSSPDTTVSGPVAGYTTISFSATSSDRRYPRNTDVGTVAAGEVGFIQARFKPGAGCTTIALGANKGPNKFLWASFNTDTGISDTYTVSDAGVSEFISATEVEPNVWELTVKVTGGDGEFREIVAHFGDGDSASGLRNNSPIADCDVGFVQFERGDAATSYIPTAGTQVTRAADDVFIPGSVNPLTETQGTIYLEGVADFGPDGISSIFKINETNTNYIRISIDGIGSKESQIEVLYRNSTQTPVRSGNLSVPPGSRYKVAFSYNDFAKEINLAVNGTIYGPVSYTHDVPSVAGEDIVLNTKNNILSDLHLYPEALSESELITLTGGT